MWVEAWLLFTAYDCPPLDNQGQTHSMHLNVTVDKLSRRNLVLPTEWMLHQEVVNQLFDRWGPALVDLLQQGTANSVHCLYPPTRTVWVYG